MEAIVYTKDDEEYALLKGLLEDRALAAEVLRAENDGHKRYDRSYDIVIVALEGAEGMEVVLEYSKRFPDANIIWVTSDRYFAGTAMRSRVCDFVERPYEPGRIGDSITKAVNNCPDRYEFQA